MANRRPVVPRTSGPESTESSDSTSSSDSTRSSGARFGARRTPEGGAEAAAGQRSRSTPFSSRTAETKPVEDQRSAKAAKSTKPATGAGPRPGASTAAGGSTSRSREPAAAARTRTARLRLVHLDPWSVMKTAFLLSIAIGIIAIVAVTIIWGVLGAAGVWDSINSSVQKTVGSDTSKPFNITDYIGTSRVVGFTMIASVIDVVVLTALATLGAFVYNLAATLLGGIEMTLAEDR